MAKPEEIEALAASIGCSAHFNRNGAAFLLAADAGVVIQIERNRLIPVEEFREQLEQSKAALGGPLAVQIQKADAALAALEAVVPKPPPKEEEPIVAEEALEA